MEWNLEEKTVIVTGGARGIGFSITKKFLENGAKSVILLDINNKIGNSSATELKNKFGADKAVFIQCDVTTDLERVSSEIISAYKTVDVLVNNAGWVREESIRDTLNLNVIAMVEWSMRFIEHMRIDKGGKGGTIINISSILGFRSGISSPFYATSKHAVLGFTKSQGHKETFAKNGVRMIALCPGYTWTDLTQEVIDSQKKRGVKGIEENLKSLIWQDPADVGKAAVEAFRIADSGTIWLIEGGNPIEEIK